MTDLAEARELAAAIAGDPQGPNFPEAAQVINVLCDELERHRKALEPVAADLHLARRLVERLRSGTTPAERDTMRFAAETGVLVKGDGTVLLRLCSDVSCLQDTAEAMSLLIAEEEHHRLVQADVYGGMMNFVTNAPRERVEDAGWGRLRLMVLMWARKLKWERAK